MDSPTTQAGDIVFDSIFPSLTVESKPESGALYVTYNRASRGWFEMTIMPTSAPYSPDCERVPGVDYSRRAP